MPVAQREFGKAPYLYAAAALLSVLILTGTMQLWKADLRIPLHDNSDTLFHAMIIKGMIDNGWFYHNAYLGMPGEQTLFDFPVVDSFNLLVLKLFSLFTSQYALILNVFFLLTYPAVTITTLYVLRQFGCTPAIATAASLLYAFSPFHLMHGDAHLFLSAYYMIPLAMLMVWWVCDGRLLGRESGSGGKSTWRAVLSGRKIIPSTAIAVLVGCTGWIYYPFFVCFFLLMGGGFAFIIHRRKRYLLPPLALILLISGVVLANLSPSLVYSKRHGENPIARRAPSDAEVYGLKIAQLLLPISGHRIAALAHIKGVYNSSGLNNENDGASLGLVGTIGFVVLLGWAAFRLPRLGRLELEARGPLHYFCLLNLAALLLGTVGGFGALFSLLITPQIRSYNRISIFIAFFSILTVALLTERFRGRFVNTLKRRIFFYAALVAIVIVGVLDQSSPIYLPEYERLKAEDAVDGAFVHRIEGLLPARAMIFQLPYMPFPESPALHRVTSYELVKGYLHSRTLRWSYGAVKNRAVSIWQKSVAAEPLEEMLRDLAVAGFDGLYIDRFGYEDGGVNIEEGLSRKLAEEPLTDETGRRSFFDLRKFKERVEGDIGPTQLDEERALISYPLAFIWAGGFSDREGTDSDNWRWCSNTGELDIENDAPKPRAVTLEMALQTGWENLADIEISVLGSTDHLRINNGPTLYRKNLNLPPGMTRLRFSCNAKPVDAPADPRILVFIVHNFHFTENRP